MSGNRSAAPGTAGPRHLHLAASLPLLAGWIFTGFGSAMVLGGILLAVDNPAGLALLAFGAVFFGVGILATNLYGIPKDRRAMPVGHREPATAGTGGMQSELLRFSLLPDNADSDAAEATAARRDLLRAQWQSRPDWAAGRVITEDEHNGHWPILAAWLWSGSAVLSVIAASIWGNIAVPISVGVILIAVSMVAIALRRHWRQRRFAASHVVLDSSPVLLGREFTAMIETGVKRNTAPARGFQVELTCVHRWEHTEFHGSDADRHTSRRREVLWTRQFQCPGQVGDDGEHYAIPLRVHLPADRSFSTLTGLEEGVGWELTVFAVLPAVDYQARFRLPILSPEMAEFIDSSGK